MLYNYADKYAEISNTDVKTWPTNVKLTMQEVCRKFNIDIENDRKNKFFWNVQLQQEIIVTEKVLDWLGYSSKVGYYRKKIAVTKFLQKHLEISYKEINDDIDIRKKYYVLNVVSFDMLMMQMRTAKAMELRQLFSILKMIVQRYCEYEKYYESHSPKLHQEDNQVLSLIETLRNDFEEERHVERERLQAIEKRQLAEQEKQRAERERLQAIERQLAEQEKQRAERERLQTIERQRVEREKQRAKRQRLQTIEREKQRAERQRLQAIKQRVERQRLQAIEERQRVEREKQRAEDRNNVFMEQLKTNVRRLRQDIAPQVVPRSITLQRYCFGLYTTPVDYHWYLMRRQVDGYKNAERRLLKRGMKNVRKWKNLSHIIDVGKRLKNDFSYLIWHGRQRIISVEEENRELVDQNSLIAMIENIIHEENEAHTLANDNDMILR